MVRQAFHTESLAEEVARATARCAACAGSPGKLRVCTGCKFARYCTRECQRAGWPLHKLVCKMCAADREIADGFRGVSAGARLHSLEHLVTLLRGSHAEAAEASTHIHLIFRRCYMGMAPLVPVIETVVAVGAAPLLAARMEAGGYGAARAVMALGPMLCSPPGAEAIAAAGAVPLMIGMLTTLTGHPELGAVRNVVAAAAAALKNAQTVLANPLFRPVALAAGLIPALVAALAVTERHGGATGFGEYPRLRLNALLSLDDLL